MRSDLEKSEMLRQTLEYQLTLIRTEHGQERALNQQLQDELHQIQCQLDKAKEEKEIDQVTRYNR